MHMSRPFEVDGIHMSLWGNSLVGMYAKCGSFEDASRGFDKIPDLVRWSLGMLCMENVLCMAELKKLLNILIACMKVYSQMMSLFFCLLSACSRAGSVDEAMSCYTPMIRVYMGSPKLEHYTCMVDSFCCAGHLQEAENMMFRQCPVNQMVPAAWRALLGDCGIHAGNVEMPFSFSDVFHAVPNNFTIFLHPWPQYQLF